jgi:hypothetical protein
MFHAHPHEPCRSDPALPPEHACLLLQDGGRHPTSAARAGGGNTASCLIDCPLQAIAPIKARDHASTIRLRYFPEFVVSRTCIMPGSDLRLLALDGGGVRGLSALMILEKLMETVNPDAPPKPCDYFDMIGGTSTGGWVL